MTYKFLPVPLHPVAETARKYTRTEWGIIDSRVLIEQPIDGDIVPGPTLQAPARDHHTICIEVSESAYPTHLDSVIVSCLRRGLPVMMYVALLESDLTTDDLKRAKEIGVGVLLVGAECVCFNGALSLSLVGVRNPEPKSWPAKYRQRISAAHQTFVNGDPAKGCSLMYDMIEDVTRRVCIKAAAKGWWRNLPNAATVPDAANPKVPLQRIAKFLCDYFNPVAAGTPGLDGKFETVVGIIGSRNEVSHPLRDQRTLQKRDLRARTRFEAAADVLRDLVGGASSLRI